MSATAQEPRRRSASFWSRTPCGSWDATAPRGRASTTTRSRRDATSSSRSFTRYAGFGSARGQSVLEIGVGLGTDHVQFARAGAELHGVDLTERGIELVRRRLELEGLTRSCRSPTPSALPFADASFDIVYSWGVLHHTPDTPSGGRGGDSGAAARRAHLRDGLLAPCVGVLWPVGAQRTVEPDVRSARSPMCSTTTWRASARRATPSARRGACSPGSSLFGVEKVVTPYDIEYAGGLARLTGPAARLLHGDPRRQARVSRPPPRAMPARRILVITYPYPPMPSVGGNRWLAMSKYLRRAGHEVDILTTGAFGALPDDAEASVHRTDDLIAADWLRKLARRPPLPEAGQPRSSTRRRRRSRPACSCRTSTSPRGCPSRSPAARRLIAGAAIDCVDHDLRV